MLAYDKPAERTAARTSPSTRTRLPVTIVTGYLGSGKTTLISALLADPVFAGTAVIVNELADIGIDQSVLSDARAGDVVLLANGCLCCARGTDLSNAVRKLIDFGGNGGQPVLRLLIETSGAADPAPIARQVCFDPQIRDRVRYGGVLCLFDALHGRDSLRQDGIGYRQIALADMVLVTKTDLVATGEAEAVEQTIAALNAVPVVTVEPRVAARFLSGESRAGGGAGAITWLGAAEAVASPHAAELATWSIRASEAVDWTMAEQALRVIFDMHGDDLLRTKGIVWTKDDARPLVVHGINRHFHRPLRLSAWDDRPETRMVVIGFPRAAEAARKIARAVGGDLTMGAASAPT